MLKIKLLIVISFVCFFIQSLFAQEQQQPSNVLIQFSGKIHSADSIPEPIPFVTIGVKGTRRGTISDVNGYFAIALYSTDTLVFSALGYSKFEFVLEDIPPNNRLYMDIKLVTHAYELQGVTVYGLTKDNFKRAFLSVELPQNVYMQKVNPKIIPKKEEVAGVPDVGLKVSPSEIIEELPFVKDSQNKKKHKKRIEKAEKDNIEIPEMKLSDQEKQSK